MKIPIIKEYDENFSDERLYRYGTRKNGFDEEIYEMDINRLMVFLLYIL